MNNVPNQEVAFLSDPDMWPSDKLRKLVLRWYIGKIDTAVGEILAQEIYEMEERYAKVVWMERQTNAILYQLKESGVKIPMDMLERLPAFRPEVQPQAYGQEHTN